MSSLSSFTGSRSVVVVSAANPSVAQGAVIPMSAAFDPGSLWNGTTYRLVAQDTGVWRVVPSRPDVGSWSVSGYSGPTVRKNGEDVYKLQSVRTIRDSASGSDVPVYAESDGIYVTVAAGDYIDLIRTSPSAGSDAVGTFDIVFERIA